MFSPARGAGWKGAAQRCSARFAGGWFPLRQEPLAAGADVAIALRPEKIALEAPPAEPGRNRLVGRIAAIAYRGDASSYEIELATGRTLRATLPNTRRRAPPFAVGQSIGLAFQPVACVVL